MGQSFFRFSFLLLLGFFLVGCVEESPTSVVFDQELKSVTFENRLFAPIVVFQDGIILDTVPAGQSYTYELNRKGGIRHAWQLIPPRGISGAPAGISPYVDLGIQYQIEAQYKITRNSVPGKEIFTPRIANFSFYDLQLYANYDESDEFLTDYVIPRNSITPDTNAPYFYWNTYSNVSLRRLGGSIYAEYSRRDTGEFGLTLDNGFRFGDAGATEPITVR